MKYLTAICLLALAPMVAWADHGPHLSPGTGTGAAPVRDSATFTETAVLAAGGLGLVLMGWAWRRSTRQKDSRR